MSLLEGLELLLQLVEKGRKLYKDCKARDGEMKSFSRLMEATKTVVNGVERVPEGAVPVVDALHALLELASTKVEKYTDRSLVTVPFYMRNEQKKMRDIEAQVRQLLPLLTVSLASSGGIEAALDDLLRRIVSLQGECAESSYHLRQIATTVDGLSHCGATRTDVQQTLTTLHGAMRDLHGDITRRVLDGCADIHVKLDAAAAKILHEVGDLNSSSAVLHVVQETLEEVQRGQGQMAANQDELMQCMQDMLSQFQHLQDQFVDSPASQLARQAGSRQAIVNPVGIPASDPTTTSDGAGPSRSRQATAMHAAAQTHHLEPIAPVATPLARSPPTLAALEHNPSASAFAHDPAHEQAPTSPEHPAADRAIKTQAELCAWLSQHEHGDRVSLHKAAVSMGGGHWPPTQQGQAVVAALAAHDWLPERTKMSIGGAVVSRVSRGGGTVTDGTIRLGRSGILVLDELCNVSFERVVFEGGTVVCLGSQAHMGLRSCRFIECVLLVIDGCKATLDKVSFKGLEGSTRSYALTARGRGTHVESRKLRIEAWAGLLIEDGAAFYGTHLALRDILFVGVHVRGEGSRAELTESCMLGRRENCHPCAFQVATRAQVDIRNCNITKFADGAHVMDGASATLHACKILRCGARGVIAENAEINLTGVDIEYALEKGVVVAGGDAKLDATNCRILQPGVAVCVSKGAQAKMNQCVLTGGLMGGLQVDGAWSSAECTSCEFNANSVSGVRVSGKANVRLKDCHCNPKTTPTHVLAAEVAGCGFHLQVSARMDVEESVCRAYGPAPACIVEAAATLRATTAKFCGRVGLLFLSGSKGELSRCTVADCGRDGVEVLRGVEVAAQNSTFERCGGSGVIVRDDIVMILQQMVPSPLIAAHGGAQGVGRAFVDGQLMHGAAGGKGEDALSAQCRPPVCKLERCQLLQNGGPGVTVMSRDCTVAVPQCKFVGNAGDVCNMACSSPAICGLGNSHPAIRPQGLIGC